MNLNSSACCRTGFQLAALFWLKSALRMHAQPVGNSQTGLKSKRYSSNHYITSLPHVKLIQSVYEAIFSKTFLFNLLHRASFIKQDMNSFISDPSYDYPVNLEKCLYPSPEGTFLRIRRYLHLWHLADLSRATYIYHIALYTVEDYKPCSRVHLQHARAGIWTLDLPRSSVTS